MKRPHSHDIDELAQRFFRSAIPTKWVVNEQSKDYGKDYLVEIGNEDGELTGSSFYVQLKGQGAVDFSANRATVNYSLKSKYAKYYLEKVRDLPVFLIVVDTTAKKGWWLFLQPELEANPLSRRRGSLTVRLPINNDITNTALLRAAIDDAKEWMRLHHPSSIHDAVVAHKQRLTRIDPRFDVAVSLVNDKPFFNLLPKEEVSLSFEISAHDKKDKELRELVDKGGVVAFQPGDIKVTGSKLFESIENTGCEIQFHVKEKGTLTLACWDNEGKEIARLSDIPGWVTGGLRELHYNGELANSPLTISLGPIAEKQGGVMRLKMEHHRWDNQRLQQLAYFDRLYSFFHALPSAATTSVECQRDGNTFFSAQIPLHSVPFAVPESLNLDVLMKARKVTNLFQVNPTWNNSLFDRETMRRFNELYGIFFDGGWSQPNPNVRLKANFVRKSFQFTVVEEINKPQSLRLVSSVSYTLLGEKLEVGRLVYDFTEMTMVGGNGRKPVKSRKATGRTSQKSVAKRHADSETIPVVFCGTKSNVMSVRQARPEDG